MSVLFWIHQLSFWTGALAFNTSLERRNNFHKRMGCFLLLVFLTTAIYFVEFWEPGINHVFLARIPTYAAMWFFQYSCWDTTKTVSLYNAMWSIAIWQIVTELWIVFIDLGNIPIEENVLYSLISLALTYGLFYSLISRTISKWMMADRKMNLGPRQMLSACLLFGIVDVLAISPEFRNITDYHGEWRFLLVCQFLCIVIMYLQNEFFKRHAMHEELAMMELLLKKEQEQYQMTKENIALINQKCHDMKHQIRALRGATREERERYISELEETVQIYENMVKTGNEVLDTILTDKSLYCKDRGILVSCVADGSQMDFMNVIDLYTLLGNALDNAIEAVEQFRNPDKRQIDVLIYRQQMFLVINIINPIEKKLVFEEELPVTTKGDRRYHGYGIRSMKYILGKYDGHMTITEEDGCFSLKMLIPIPEKN